MSEFDLFFGLVAIGCGLYCLYSAYMMKKTGIISKTLMLDQETAKLKCTNVGEFLLSVLPCTIILGIVVTMYGAIILLDSYVVDCGIILTILLLLSGAVLIWFAVVTSKAKKKYFE